MSSFSPQPQISFKHVEFKNLFLVLVLAIQNHNNGMCVYACMCFINIIFVTLKGSLEINLRSVFPAQPLALT